MKIKIIKRKEIKKIKIIKRKQIKKKNKGK